MPTAKSGVTTVDATPASAAVAGQGLDTPLRFVTGIGPQRAKLLAKLGLDTVEDVLLHLPSRHEDRSQLVPLARITEGRVAHVRGDHPRRESAAPRPEPRAPVRIARRWHRLSHRRLVQPALSRADLPARSAAHRPRQGGALRRRIAPDPGEGLRDRRGRGGRHSSHRSPRSGLPPHPGAHAAPAPHPHQATPRRLRPPRPGGRSRREFAGGAGSSTSRRRSSPVTFPRRPPSRKRLAGASSSTTSSCSSSASPSAASARGASAASA